MNLLKSTRLYCVLALVAAPATLNALSDYYFNIVYYGSIGPSNYASGTGSLAVGSNNNISYSSSSSSAAIGTALQVYNANSLVVGAYNVPTAGAAFIVGNGSSTTRNNAMEVMTDGTVKIPGTANIGKVPARGGISMGSFTAP